MNYVNVRFFLIDKEKSYLNFFSIFNASTTYSKIKFKCKFLQVLMFLMFNLIKCSLKST
jgi:hypothetical protein